MLEFRELARATQQANRPRRGVPLLGANRPRQQRSDLLLPQDRRFEHAGLTCRFEPELAVESRAELAVGLERVMLTTQGVESEHRRSLSAFAEAIERRGRLSVREPRFVVELSERCVGRFEVGSEHSSAIGAAKVLRPKCIRLVFQDVAAYE